MKKILLLSAFAFSSFIVLTSGIEDNNGKAGRTGSPSEQTCVNGCHDSYALNSGTGSVVLTSNIPNNEYTPGQVYLMSLTVAHTGRSLFGLGLEALTSSNANAGALVAGVGNQIKNTTVGGVSRKNITHTLNGGSGTTDLHTFNFSWTAPAAGTGNATFYFTGVAANGNNSNSQDYVYSGSQIFTEYVAPSSVNETNSDLSSLNVFPNPAKDVLHIHYSLLAAEKVTVTAYSMTGEVVSRLEELNQSSGDHSIQTNVSALGRGIYLLEVKTGSQSATKRIVVE